MTPAELENYKLHRRFDRMGRLIGDRKMKKLMDSHVMIIGLGGVGSWAAESVMRSGVGQVTVVDFDEICITNANRQLHALSGLVGEHKAEVMGERLRKINPLAKVNVRVSFYSERTANEVFDVRPGYLPDYVIDAIDNVTAKCHLLNFCKTRKIPVVCSAGSAGKLDPTRLEIADLALTEVDPLAKAIRRILRQQYGFPEKGSFGIPTVFSREEPIAPEELTYDGGKGFRCVCPKGQNDLNSCDQKNVILGNASFVTGAFGLACASVAVRDLMAQA